MTGNPNQAESSAPRFRLDSYSTGTFTRGRSRVVEVLWWICAGLFVSSGVPGSRHRRFLLRLFGAKLGRGVVIKPRVRIKFPWRLSVGDHSWIGEAVWIDNLARVEISSHAVLSQGAYLCTGNHDRKKLTFDLMVAPIYVGPGAWVCAKSCIGPGVRLGANVTVGLGAVVTSDIDAGQSVSAGAAS